MPGETRTTTLDLRDDELTALLSGAADLAAHEMRATREGPIFAEPPSAERLAALLAAERELPVDGAPLEAVLHAAADILAAGRRTAPGFFGYVLSPPSPVGVAGDLLASAADQNVTSWRSAPAATELERIVVRWLARFVGFADDCGGILLAGGSAANLTALLLALRADDARRGSDRRRLVVYASEEVHFSVTKAADVIGVQMRRVAVQRDRRLDPNTLRELIGRDRDAGLEPICVVASAGTTTTGAVDPLDAAADIAAEHHVWFHVDGAYGAPAAADPASRELFAGIERADSLALDGHKWLYTPVDCGALLVRDPLASAKAFGSGSADYVRVLGDEAFAFWDHGLELSRRFRALKLWMTLRYYGSRRVARAIAEDVAMAGYMAELISADEELELLAGPGLSICCFRHLPAGMPESELDSHNERLLDAIQRDGRVYLSNASIDGRLALRACITNFRTTERDVDRTLATVRELGGRLAARRS